jgi:glycosyltransferase involved in cell wall biosynthesis
VKILFITDNFPPEVNAPATRTFEHCQEWLKQGAEVTVITCAPNFPHGKTYRGYANRFYQKESVKGIDVVRVWSYMSPNSGFVRRILDYMSFALSAFIAGLFQKSDVIIATSPQFFTTWSAAALSVVKRRPWIFELRDIWPESIHSVGAMDRGKIFNALEKIELALYCHSDKVIAVTDAFKINLMLRGIPGSQIEVVTNGSNRDLFSPRPKDEKLLASLHLSGKFVVGYIGTHGLAHSLEFIVNTIAKVDDFDIHFLFIGDGAMKRKVVALADELQLVNVTFLDSVAKEEVPRYLASVDLLLVPLKKEENFKAVIPSKIFEASAMHRPILLGVEGQAQEIIERYGAGLCFEPENEEDFLAKVKQLKDDTVLYAQCQSGCERLAKDYDRKIMADMMYKIIMDVVDKK